MTGSAEVHVSSASLTTPDWWCQHYLKLTCQGLFLREIMMTSGKFSCWFARSYFPAATWYLHSDLFSQLAHHTLGDIIFDTPQIKRTHSHYVPVTQQHIPFYWIDHSVLQTDDPLWLKVSSFSVADQSEFFLAELFLPELACCLQSSGLHTGA